MFLNGAQDFAGSCSLLHNEKEREGRDLALTLDASCVSFGRRGWGARGDTLNFAERLVQDTRKKAMIVPTLVTNEGDLA